MNKFKVILDIWGHGAIYGAGIGTLFGCAFGLPLMIFGGLLVILIGLGVGFGLGLTLGAVNGFFAGIITLRFFYPLRDIRRYRLVITLICVIIPAAVAPFVLQWVWFGHFSWSLQSGWFIFALMAMIAGLFVSHWLTTWYTSKN